MEKLQHLVGTGFMYHLTIGILQFAIVLLTGWLVKLFLTTVGRRLIAKTESGLDDKILEIAVDRLPWLALVFGFYLATGTISKAIPRSNTFGVNALEYFEGIIFVSFALVVTLIVIRIVDTSVNHAIETHARKTSSRFNEALLPLINRLLNIIVAVIAIIVVLDHFGQNISTLVVSLGVGSLAIALAAQETIANMIGGFVIMLDRPFRVGDRIQLPSGEVGDVYEIGIRSTKILDFDNNLIISPNADLIKSRIINHSYPEQATRVVVDVGVAYGTEIAPARQIMLDLARRHPDVLREPAPEVFVVALAESSANLRLVARTDDFRKKFLIETMMREHIYNTFLDRGIEIPFPHRVVELRKAHGKSQSPQKRKTLRR